MNKYISICLLALLLVSCNQQKELTLAEKQMKAEESIKKFMKPLLSDKDFFDKFYNFKQVDYSYDYLESLSPMRDSCNIGIAWRDGLYTSENYTINSVIIYGHQTIIEDVYFINSNLQIMGWYSYKKNKNVVCELCDE